MAQSVHLEIDLTLLQDHFAKCGKAMSIAAIETWLRQMGFTRDDDAWAAEELSLMALDRTEYRVVRQL